VGQFPSPHHCKSEVSCAMGDQTNVGNEYEETLKYRGEPIQGSEQSFSRGAPDELECPLG
jgi:hypothetical protein